MESEFSSLEMSEKSLEDQNVGEAVCVTVFCHSISYGKLMQMSCCEEMSITLGVFLCRCFNVFFFPVPIGTSVTGNQ